MKRPFVLIACVGFASAVILCSLNTLTVSAVGLTALAVFFLSLCFISLKSKHAWLIFSSFAVAVISISVFSANESCNRISGYDKTELNITGTVTGVEYYGSYERLEIRVKSVNGKTDTFLLTAYSNEKTGAAAGDRISAKSVSGRISGVSCIGENKYYQAVNKIKEVYKNTVSNYLPKELSAVAVAMTIGDREDLSTYLRNCFNYSGTAHLLVVSGLHLTVWTLLLSRLVPFLRKNRTADLIISGAFILLYLALTGFSVSVVRAGIMLMIIKSARSANRDSDSLNALGIAVFLLLAVNPSVVSSASFLLSVGSALGLILFARNIRNFIFKSKIGKIITRDFVGRLISESAAVSISVSVFTIPVFILKFDMFPIFSFLTNIIIVDLATAVMLLTVLGAAFDLLGLVSISRLLFYLVGIGTRLMIKAAENIGMHRYSTVSVSAEEFKLLLLLAAVFTLFFIVLCKYKNVRKSILPTVLALSFIVTSFYSQNFELAHPSVDVGVGNNGTAVLVRDGYDSVLILMNGGIKDYAVRNMLGKHNLKEIGCIYIAETDDYTVSEIKRIVNTYPADNLLFKAEKPELLNSMQYRENVSSVTINNAVTVKLISAKTAAVNTAKENILISFENSLQNPFEFDNKYDIIILSTQSFELFGEEAVKHLKNSSSQIIELKENNVTVYPDVRKIYCME